MSGIPLWHASTVPLDVHPQLLRALRTVIDTGSLTAASERLGFTQSALSKQIATLEAAAGTQLLHRHPRGVEVTEAGRRLAIRAAAVLDQLDVAERELRALEAPVGGRVALGAFPTAAVELVPSTLARLRTEHPAVAVDLVVASTPVQLRRLRSGRVDLAVVAAGDDLPEWGSDDLELEPLPAGRLLVAVSRHHRLAGAGRVGVADLVDEDWVVGRGARGEPQFGAWPTLRDPRVLLELTEWTARLGFVAAGLGITTVPTLIAASLPRGVLPLEVHDPALLPRSLLLATAGGLGQAAATVRDVLVQEASRIAGRSG